jgi:hypothetical protein
VGTTCIVKTDSLRICCLKYCNVFCHEYFYAPHLKYESSLHACWMSESPNMQQLKNDCSNMNLQIFTPPCSYGVVAVQLQNHHQNSGDQHFPPYFQNTRLNGSPFPSGQVMVPTTRYFEGQEQAPVWNLDELDIAPCGRHIRTCLHRALLRSKSAAA